MATLKTPAAALVIFERLSQQHPNADTELHYRTAFELLAATILSAQSTDVGVNAATPALFARFPDARALAAADPAEVEVLVKSTGFFRQKARAIIGMAQGLVANHGGDVPASMDALVHLPGVGRKTANVVLGHALGVPGLAVDRHVLRVANRIGLAHSDDPERVEQQLTGALPAMWWTRASDILILHGRRICKPVPQCDRCAIRPQCDWRGDAETPGKTTSTPAARKTATGTRQAAAPASKLAARARKAPGPRR
jgi:endonuclease III